MKVSAIVCKKCGDTVYSRARHDMRWCSCGECAVDGGQQDYIKVTGQRDNWELKNIEVDVDINTLYEDWNHGEELYGIIKREYSKSEIKRIKIQKESKNAKGNK